MAIRALAVSSEEVILAMMRAGFAVERRQNETVLRRDHRAVSISASPLLSYDRLIASLRAVGMSYSEFLEHLSAVPLEPVSSVRACSDDGDDDDGSRTRRF